LANVDPVGVSRALEGLNPETTLAIVVSKTFTTVETMLNARTVRKWLTDVRSVIIVISILETYYYCSMTEIGQRRSKEAYDCC
jgi:glucose-6-phosphate isomerase